MITTYTYQNAKRYRWDCPRCGKHRSGYLTLDEVARGGERHSFNYCRGGAPTA